MSAQIDFVLDQTGKIDLNAIYNRPDPRDYYQTISTLDYRIPAAAEPVFRTVIAAMRRARERRRLVLLDAGCSYGVNAAILKHNCDLSELTCNYGASVASALSHRDLISRDRGFLKGCVADRDLEVIGLDTADNAVGYACDAGLLDGGIVTNLERQSPTAEDAALMAEVDLVISTGAIGYVGEPTFRHILDCAGRAPWFALFALRMFPIDPTAAALKECGYEVFRLVGKTFRQRRFAGRDEAAEVLGNLAALGIDPTGRESEGWYHAEFFFARKASEAAALPMADLTAV